MNTLITRIAALLCLFTASFVSAQDKVEPDTALIRKLGADKNGMKKYVMAFLKSGPNRTMSKDSAMMVQKAHMENIERMAKAGKLIVAGPFLDKSDYRGIYIFNVESVEEAKTLTESDPAIKTGRLVMELHPWYGSASLIESVKIHDRLQSK